MPQIRFPGESPELRRARVLRDRVEDLRTARQRIIAAADAERRRIERDLHDGAQQRLVALAVTLSVAESRIESDPAGAAQLVAQAREEAQLAAKELRELARGIHPAVLSDHGLGPALEELRELARGIHPAVLTDHGLVPALEMLAERSSIPVELCATLDDRLPAPVEAAAYYIVAEALTNVTRHARASGATVSIARNDGHLTVEVSDDGGGGADPARGSGLEGLADRLDALSGRLEVASPPGGGTRLRAEIPCV